jgi:peptidoglycan/xylan/chitin deacetylase (PgdA/CDA1 family)
VTSRRAWKALKHAGTQVISWVPTPLWHHFLGTELIVPRYHVVGDTEPAHVDGLSIFRELRRFKEDLDFFLATYVPVSLKDVVEFLDGVGHLPRRCFLLTFDDGFREAHDVIAPLLASKGIPAVFFLNPCVIDNHELLSEQKKCLLVRALGSRTDPRARQRISEALTQAGIGGTGIPLRIRGIPRASHGLLDTLAHELDCDFAAYAAEAQPYISSEQAQHLIRQGFALGAHSMDHPRYTELSLDQQLAETRESIRFLSERFRYQCVTFAFPYYDTGVLPDFFRNIYADGELKVSFGSDGMHRHFFPRNLERLKMEYPGVAAPQILAREYCLALVRKPWWTAKIPAVSGTRSD